SLSPELFQLAGPSPKIRGACLLATQKWSQEENSVWNSPGTRSRFMIWRGGPNAAFVSPFGKRERALPAIGITLGVIENKNNPVPQTGSSREFWKEPQA